MSIDFLIIPIYALFICKGILVVKPESLDILLFEDVCGVENDHT